MTLTTHESACADGWLGRVDAAWKIAAIAVLVAATISLSTPGVALAACAGGIGLALAAGVPYGTVASRTLPLAAMAMLCFGWAAVDLGTEGVGISRPALLFLMTLVAKTVALATLVVTLLAATPIHEVGRGLGSLGVPRIFVQIALLTHRYVFVLGDEFLRLRRALRVRGFRNRMDRRSFTTIGHVAGTLFVRGHERADRVYHAMAARGFDGVYRSLGRTSTRASDVAFLLAAVLIGSIAVVFDRGWWPI